MSKHAEHLPPPLLLIVKSGPAVGQRLVLDRPVLLGRDPSTRIPLTDDRISRHHAMIDIVDGTPVVRDLGSKNGTFLNGVELKEPRPLRPTDRLRLGKTLLAVASDKDAQDDLPPDHWDPLDTHHDSLDSPLPIAAEFVRLERKTIRLAADAAGRLAETLRTRHPLSNFTIAIRKEFRAEAAGCFLPADTFEPAYVEGSLVLTREQVADLNAMIRVGDARCALLDPTSSRGTGTRLRSPLLVIPLPISDQATQIMIVRREESDPFGEGDVQFAEMLVECLRVAPLENLLRDAVPNQLPSHLGIIGSSDAMKRVRELLRSYAATNATVLIRGESGTGKELCARAIAHLSQRRFGPFVEMNAACMTPDLIEAELFGHEKGSFTGAIGQRIGKLEMANNGTLFLDEIGELPLDLQAKLLRVLEGQPFYRIGGNQLIRTDVRFVSATNRNLEAMVTEGRFREDLYHRINILTVALPPLREHIEDLPELVTYLLPQIQEGERRPREFTVSPKAYRRLLCHRWPGNVRELRNILQRIALLAEDDLIQEDMIPTGIGDQDSDTTHKLPRLQVLTEMMEREEITRILLEAHGQKSRAAKLLGISRPTLDKKIRFYGLHSLVSKTKEGSSPDHGSMQK